MDRETVKKSYRLLPWQRQMAIELYRDNEKLEAIAAEFGCSAANVSQLARRAGLPRRLAGGIK